MMSIRKIGWYLLCLWAFLGLVSLVMEINGKLYYRSLGYELYHVYWTDWVFFPNSFSFIMVILGIGLLILAQSLRADKNNTTFFGNEIKDRKIMLRAKEIGRKGFVVLMGSRKGQFFLVAAMVFMFIIFSLVMPYNTIHEIGGSDEHISDLSDNFNKEAPKVVNKATFEDKAVEDELENFATNFQGYATQQEPTFGVAYVYVNPETHVITISNILADKKIKIVPTDTNGNPVPISGDLIFSKDTATTGSICLSGLGNVGCTSANSKVSSWGAGLSNTKIDMNTVDVDKIDLRIEDQPAIRIPRMGSIKKYASGLGQILYDERVNTETGEKIIDVYVCDLDGKCT